MLYGEFVSCAEHFLEISNKINDGWSLKNYKGNIYLVKCFVQIVKESGGDSNSSKDTDDFTLNLESDDQCLTNPPLKFRKWEYHVLHSLTYQVPVLYFNAWDSSGQLLSLDELWMAVHPNFQASILQNKWFTLTQQEHPYLFKPFFHFHPCHTEDFLNCFADPQSNKLIIWLSSIGQVIWLKIDSLYGKHIHML